LSQCGYFAEKGGGGVNFVWTPFMDSPFYALTETLLSGHSHPTHMSKIIAF